MTAHKLLLSTMLAVSFLATPSLAHDDDDHGAQAIEPGAVLARMQRGPEVVLTYDNRLMNEAGALNYAHKDCADFKKSLIKLTFQAAKPGSYLASAVFRCK